MSVLLLAGSAGYVIVKWRLLLPAVAEGIKSTATAPVTQPRDIALSASVTVAAGSIGMYAFTLQDPLLAYTPSSLAALATLFSAVCAITWPTCAHWKIAALQLSMYVCVHLYHDESHKWLGAVCTLFVLHALAVGVVVYPTA